MNEVKLFSFYPRSRSSFFVDFKGLARFLQRDRESPFLLDQEEENGGSALRVSKPSIKPRNYNNYHGDKTQL